MDMPEYTIANLLIYSRSLAEELLARFSRIKIFVTNNNHAIGTVNEIIIRDFLSQIALKNHTVAQGFICNPLYQASSRQCDVIVFDEGRYAPVYSLGEIKIVWPESVVMVIEVKTDMKGAREVKEAIENIKSAKSINSKYGISFPGIIFAFHSISVKRLMSILTAIPERSPHRPLAVLLMDKGVIIQQQGSNNNTVDTQFGGDSVSPYEVRISNKGEYKEAFVVNYLLLLFLKRQAEIVQSLHRETIENAMAMLLDQNAHIPTKL